MGLIYLASDRYREAVQAFESTAKGTGAPDVADAVDVARDASWGVHGSSRDGQARRVRCDRPRSP